MGKSVAIGFIGAAVAAFGFGSNFIIIKKWSPGDGMFFQLNMNLAVWMTGLVHYMALGCPPVQPVAMIGGALWATGNLMCPLIIDCIGLGLGLLIWGSANMVVGWSSAHFGILGVKQQFVPHPAMNCIGAAIAVVAIMVYSQVGAAPAHQRAPRPAPRAPPRRVNTAHCV